MTDQSPPAADETSERIEFGSVLPNATGPDVFYDTLDAAIADCAMGPCRIVQRTVTVTPWVPATDPPVPATPSGTALDDDPFCQDCGAGQHELVAERERAAAEKAAAAERERIAVAIEAMPSDWIKAGTISDAAQIARAERGAQ
ncbi:hypothetical protein EFK50_07725 [Nocardioides marmoriginsengisoli]|uniref:Uncharacterized protein n=1 Tax=Nocardioides marmoriginsengisoli TaxID=661483 RepID=A0A3N0CJK5_9ACTN|nr:hypothetical protein [Nocardioides marmoriginsengisoli]RNL63624.1 hypothetical protein EFK50_07725 [Nocardioides marmoriginsengisoli]